MTHRIRVSPEAKQEIKKAKEWYEKQSPGLGDRFSTEIKNTVKSLGNFNVDHKPTFTTHRRILLFKFPYVIYYKRDEKKGIVKIIAVLHNKQSHERLEGRL